MEVSQGDEYKKEEGSIITENPSIQLQKVEMPNYNGNFEMQDQLVVSYNRPVVNISDPMKTDLIPSNKGMKPADSRPCQSSPNSVAASSDDSGILSEQHDQASDNLESILTSSSGDITSIGENENIFLEKPAVDGYMFHARSKGINDPSVSQPVSSASWNGPTQTIEVVPEYEIAAEIGDKLESLAKRTDEIVLKEELDSSVMTATSNNTILGTVSIVSNNTCHESRESSSLQLSSSVSLGTVILEDLPSETVSFGQVLIKDEPLDNDSCSVIKLEPELEKARETNERQAFLSNKQAQLAKEQMQYSPANEKLNNEHENLDNNKVVSGSSWKRPDQNLDVREVERKKRLVVVVEDFLKIRLHALSKAEGKRTKSHDVKKLSKTKQNKLPTPCIKSHDGTKVTKRKHNELPSSSIQDNEQELASKTKYKYVMGSSVHQRSPDRLIMKNKKNIKCSHKNTVKGKHCPMLPNVKMKVDKKGLSTSKNNKRSPVKVFVEKEKLRQSNQYDSRRKFILPANANFEKITMNHPGNTQDFVEDHKHVKKDQNASKYKALDEKNKEIVEKVLHNPKNERFRNSVINFKKGIFLCQLCNKRFRNRKGYVRHQREHVRSIEIYQPFITKGPGPLKNLNPQDSGDSQEQGDDDTSDSEYGDKHICKICGKTLHSKRSFKHHKTIHKRIDPTDLPRCKLCGTFFTKMTSVHHHLRNAHYICWQCGMKCNDTKDLHQHRKKSHSALCEICGQSCDSSKALTQHAAYHFLAKGPEKIKTKYQIQKEAREKLIETCKIKVVGDSIDTGENEEEGVIQDEQEENIGQVQFKETNGKNYECPYVCHCGRRLKTWDSFQAHSMIHRGLKPYSCPICNKGFLSSSSRVTHVRHCHSDDRPYQCTYCEASFKSTSAKDVHIRLHHTKEKPHRCDDCGKMFSLSSSLKSHKQAWHSIKAEYVCKVCEREFKLPGTLSIHMRQHTGEKPYACKQCGKAFRQGSHLRTHVRTHSNERLYPCQICNKAFTQSSHLNTHMKIHLDNKDHKCNYCGKGFNLSSTLKTHLRVHTGEKPFECRICGKTFNQSSARKSHERCHSDEKPLECEICGNRFKLKGTLKTHMLVHSKELPHKCNYCEKEFTTSSSLKVHVNSKHELKLKYSCKHCDKKFVARHLLDRHLVTHEESSISCNECGKILKNKYTLQSHFKKCH